MSLDAIWRAFRFNLVALRQSTWGCWLGFVHLVLSTLGCQLEVYLLGLSTWSCQVEVFDFEVLNFVNNWNCWLEVIMSSTFLPWNPQTGQFLIIDDKTVTWGKTRDDITSINSHFIMLVLCPSVTSLNGL